MSYTYTIRREALPESMYRGEPGTPEEPKPWFLPKRTGEHLELVIFGNISCHGLETFRALFDGVDEVDMRLVDCLGGASSVADELARRLLSVGRDHVRCHVVGHCASAAIDLMMMAGFVSASWSAKFLVHGPTAHVLQRDGNLSGVFDALDAEYTKAADTLRLRLGRPEEYLDGRDHIIDATTALQLGLVDSLNPIL
jgi:hypothetical protein